MKKIATGFAVALFATAIMSPVSAKTIPFNMTIWSNYIPGPGSDSDRDLQTGASLSASTNSSHAQSVNGGYVGTSASADLASGQLKARSYSDDPNGEGLYNRVNAMFGDGFRALTDDGAYDWSGGGSGKFTLNIDGTLSSSSALEEMNLGGFVLLALYTPGTLDPNGNLVGGANMIDYYLWFIGNPNQNLFSCDTSGNCVPLAPSETVYDLSSGLTLTQDIFPGGDFDWSITLGFSGQNFIPGDYDLDLSHTLTLGYEGPQGTTTGSISGLFKDTVKTSDAVPAPEPLTLSLLGAGLLGLTALRRRRLVA